MDPPERDAMHRTTGLSAAAFLALASLALISTSGSAPRAPQSRAVLRVSVTRVAPMEADAAAEAARADPPTRIPGVALPTVSAPGGDGFHYGDGAVGAAVAAGACLALLGLVAGIRRHRVLAQQIRPRLGGRPVGGPPT